MMFTVQDAKKLSGFSDGEEPVVTSWGRWGNWQLVGHGYLTSSKCGFFKAFYGCLNGDLHNRISLDGQLHADEGYVKPVFVSCDKPTCPQCYRYGWAVREAQAIEDRLGEAAKKFGMVQHIIFSVPPREYGSGYVKLRHRCDAVALSRGVYGGVKIFHGFRYNNPYEARAKNQPVGWYWSPHFHVLGFIAGGYGKCRGCVHHPNVTHGQDAVCLTCGGFEDRTRKLNKKDGWIVKVEAERITVGGTAWYQLTHSSVDVTKKRFQVATWFGVVSYRKFKYTPEKRKTICPICKHELVKLLYFGSLPEILKWKSETMGKGKAKGFFVKIFEEGRQVWEVDTREFFKKRGGEW